MQYKCLSIAGFDGSGGAGIQADLKTFSALGCYGMTVLTALPVQNTCGVRRCYRIPLSCIKEQLEAIFDDIMPDAIKVGMLFSIEIIELVAAFLGSRAQAIPVVVDPVMVAKSGDPLLEPEAVIALKRNLVPVATLITPNLPEAQALVPGFSGKTEMAEELLALGCHAVLLKGGHDEGETSDDLFLDQARQFRVLSAPRVRSNNTHGTGCTLSAAVASFLARGASLFNACELAKQYLFEAISAAKDQTVGKGHGPVHHFYKSACSEV